MEGNPRFDKITGYLAEIALPLQILLLKIFVHHIQQGILFKN